MRVVVVAGRNKDVCEVRVVEGEEHEHVIARAGLVNGFKNIQNLVRRLGEGREKKSEKGATRRRVVRKRERERERGATTSTSATGNGVAVDLTECALVEVNACPGGCANGGGLFAPPEGDGVSPAEWLTAVVEALAQIKQQPVSQLPPVDTKRTSLLPLSGGGTPGATTAQGSQGSSAQDPLVVAAW